jgi:hypothetical protein
VLEADAEVEVLYGFRNDLLLPTQITLTGSEFPIAIHNGVGQGTRNGAGGSDRLYGLNGNDTLNGNGGDDTISGGGREVGCHRRWHAALDKSRPHLFQAALLELLAAGARQLRP